MSESGSSKVMVLLVILTVVLSVVFTWKALAQSSPVSKPAQNQGSETASAASEPSGPAQLVSTDGQVGINVYKKGGA